MVRPIPLGRAVRLPKGHGPFGTDRRRGRWLGRPSGFRLRRGPIRARRQAGLRGRQAMSRVHIQMLQLAGTLPRLRTPPALFCAVSARQSERPDVSLTGGTRDPMAGARHERSRSPIHRRGRTYDAPQQGHEETERLSVVAFCAGAASAFDGSLSRRGHVAQGRRVGLVQHHRMPLPSIHPQRRAVGGGCSAAKR
jgi:hypothetical protein